MAQINRIIVYDDKHEADLELDGTIYRITTADLAKLKVKEGDFASVTVTEKLAYYSSRLSCIKKAFSLLAYADLSQRRLCMRLADSFDRELAEEVAELMCARGYIDEYSAAARFADRCAQVKLWGPDRITSELLRRGFVTDAVSEAVAALDDDYVYDNLLTLVKKKTAKTDITDIKIKSKLCASLRRMGYSYAMINTALGDVSLEDDC